MAFFPVKSAYTPGTNNIFIKLLSEAPKEYLAYLNKLSIKNYYYQYVQGRLS